MTGSEVTAGCDLEVADGTFVWPDVMVVLGRQIEGIEERPLRTPPDIVVEISSPSTRRRDLIRKRACYERFGVAEYWFVDLDENRILIFRLENGRYAEPNVFTTSDLLESKHLPGFTAPVDRLLNPVGPDAG